MSMSKSSMGGGTGFTTLVGYLLFLAALGVALVATYLTLTP
jgi:hypothetical protein